MITFNKQLTNFFYNLFALLLLALSAKADVVEYRLLINYSEVNYSGKDIKAMTVNGAIPGSTLAFSVGDTARITVKNNMDVETSIHWHGVLLPNRQDGVPYLTTPPILPGKTLTFEFPIIHSGTYWYHSHTGLQEQRGVYGSLIFHPKKKRFKVDREYLLVFSDWTDENPNEVLRTLKRGSEYYAFKKGAAQSVVGAFKRNAVGDMLMRSLMRMPPMDISDVAYDAFLTNGEQEHLLQAKAGEKVLLRLINASASTYMHLEFAGGTMNVVAADGVDLKPKQFDRLLMAVAETYDVIISVPEKPGAFEFRATAQDGSGHTSAFLGDGYRVFASDIPKPNIYKMMHGSFPIKHVNEGNEQRPLAPYEELQAARKTVLLPNRKWREFNLQLNGDMERYVWSINNKVLSESDVIKIKRGENVRFVLENKTMMHHPMHLHGHFFRVVNKHGDYSPLKHTVDVPPLGRRVIEFAANEDKDWFFHCHVLYHMKGGMARVVHYEDSKLDDDIEGLRKNFGKDHWYYWADAKFLSQMTDGEFQASNTRNILSAKWEAEWGEDPYEVELKYERYINRFLRPFLGVDFDEEENRGIFGAHYLLSLNIDSAAWVDTEGEFRFSLEKELLLTDRFLIFGDVEYDTAELWEGVAGGKLLIDKRFSVVGQWHSEFGSGGGIEIRF